jgi:hypothetical protein
MNDKELIKELETCLSEISNYCREAIQNKPEGQWIFVLGSIELRALRAIEQIVKKERKDNEN